FLMKIADVEQCAFNSWYHTFESYTQESIFINLPDDLIASLTNDEFILPKSAKPTNGHLSDLDNDGIWSDYSDTDEKNSERPEFPQFESQLKSIIRKLGGVVFPKLNWSAPSDDGKMRIQIIDFNVFGPPTEALLFQWSELENDVHENDTIPLFRYQSDQNIRPNSVNQYSVPIDLIDIASGSDPVKVMDFIQAVSPETYSYSYIVFHINSTNVNLCY
ncbi:uncharacterized protein DC041_0010947, partial [Schistosoma bovis]